MNVGASSLLLFWSPLNIHAFRGERTTEAWTEYRFRHWLAFTLQSILHQREGELRYWLVCDPALRSLTEPWRSCIRDERVELVYLDECPDRFRGLPRRNRYLVARLDSDDMYHPAVAANLLRRPTTSEFFQFNQGYACQFDTGDVRSWNSRSSPFYCHVYGEELRSLETWVEPNHTTVRPTATVLGSGHFLVALHQQNTSSSIALGSERFFRSRARTILSSFGLGRTRTLRSVLESTPVTADWQRRKHDIRDELRLRHSRYSSDVTTEPMAISLETATFVYFLCEALAARRILDLGSGFGSVVARTYAALNRGVVCHSVDTSPEWLERTERFLRASGLPADGLFLWSDFRLRDEPQYDLVLHDLGDLRVREETFEEALGFVLPTGFILVNDHHDPAFARSTADTLRHYSADVVPESEDLTRDRFGRCALLLARVIGPLPSSQRH